MYYIPVVRVVLETILLISNITLCGFVHISLSKKPLGHQTFLDLCYKGLFLSWTWSFSTIMLFLISTQIFEAPESLMIEIWAFACEVVFVVPMVWMFFCIIVRSLEIYTNAISDSIFDEAKILWKFCVSSLIIPFLSLALEFTFYDIKTYFFYRALTMNFQISFKFSSITILSVYFLNCFFLTILHIKLEFDRIINNESSIILRIRNIKRFLTNKKTLSKSSIENKESKPGFLTLTGSIVFVTYSVLLFIFPHNTVEGSISELIVFIYNMTFASTIIPLLFIIGSPFLLKKLTETLKRSLAMNQANMNH